MTTEDGNTKKDTWQVTRHGGGEGEMKLLEVLAFGLIGATATTLAVTQLRQTVDWIYSQEEAWRRYNKRMEEAYEEEMERVERIKRMQGVFNRERNKHRRGYDCWKENETGGYIQQFQCDDWYWKAEASFRNQWANSQGAHPPRSRKTAYTEAEIKMAFRARAIEVHPDQNQSDREMAEAKFKELFISYEAIKKERENNM